jgi:LDH2 family malate/lactate/ureidoglycolate dehydrogenase
MWATAAFEAVGMSAADAATVVDQLVSDDLRGVYSHGLLRVPNYIERLRCGVTDPSGQPTVISCDGATGHVDGANAMGQVVAAFAMSVAIDLAREQGVSFVAVRHSNHFGSCAHYAMMAVRHEMIGIAATVGGKNIMAPWGGTAPLLGNNPFGVAIPALEAPPIVLDMAMSVAAGGKIILAAKSGSPIPPEWALDEAGQPTTDPVVALRRLLVRPVGDHKGYGMALVVGILAGLLPGAAFGLDVRDLREDFANPQNVGHLLMALDPGKFGGTIEFRRRVDEAISLMHDAPRATGFDRILVPGEQEAENEARQAVQGIDYPLAVLLELNQIGAELGVGTLAELGT